MQMSQLVADINDVILVRAVCVLCCLMALLLSLFSKL